MQVPKESKAYTLLGKKLLNFIHKAVMYRTALNIACFVYLIIAIFLISLQVNIVRASSNINDKKEIIKIPLDEFTANPLSFYSIEDSQVFYFPYQKGLFSLEDASITIDYYHSEMILSEISQIILKLNEKTICQRKLYSKLSGGIFECKIPLDLIKTGYNKIEIRTSLHYDKECEIPTVKFLWLDINTNKSFLKFKIREKKREITILDINRMFSELNTEKPKVNFIILPINEKILELTSLLVGKIALLRNFRDIDLKISNKIENNYINIIITLDKNQLKALNSNLAKNDFSGIKIFQEKNRIITIFIGKNINELRKIVENFVYGKILPEKNSWSLEEIRKGISSSSSQEFKRILLHSNEIITFLEKGQSHISLRSLTPKEKGLYFKIAPELYLAENKYAILGLHFSYSAGLRKDSNLHILLNGKLINSIPLDDPRGRVFKNYKIYIPLSQFLPGTNFLSFKTFLKPRKAEKCSPLIPESFRVDIFGDSYIELPKIGIYHEMPDLNSFFDTIFPYTFWLEQGEEVYFILENENYSPKLMELIYYMTQQIKNIPKVRIKFESTKIDKNHFIFIGSKINIPKIEKLLDNFSKNKIIITQMAINDNPFQEGTAILYVGNKSLKQIFSILKTKKFKGDTIIYDIDNDYTIELNLSKPYAIGHKPMQTGLENNFFRKPELFYIIIISLIIILGIITGFLVWKRKKRRLEQLSS